ncbi:MAG: hypothetical protein DWB99_05360 [Candidatus Poseidoniales archaeon]|nr:MAG: hypothetical protein DWB99_05360 [Candidatus Poseidoniales archaeon]
MRNHVSRWEDLPPGDWLANDEHGVHWFRADDGSHWYSVEDGYRLWEEENTQSIDNSKTQNRNKGINYEDFYDDYDSDDYDDDDTYVSGSFRRKKSLLPAILMLIIIGVVGASGYFFYDYITKEVPEPALYGQIYWDYSDNGFDVQEVNGLQFQQDEVTRFYPNLSEMCDEDPQIDESGQFCIREVEALNVWDRGDYYEACEPELITCVHLYIQEKGMTIYDPEWENCADIVGSIEKPELVADDEGRLNPTDEWMEQFYQIKSEIKYERPTVCDESFDV